MTGSLLHFILGKSQERKLPVGKERSPDQQKLFRRLGRDRRRMARERAEKAGVLQANVLDPVVRLGIGDYDGLKVQVVELAMGNDNHVCPRWNHSRRGADKNIVEFAGVWRVAGFTAIKYFPVAGLHLSFDLGFVR